MAIFLRQRPGRRAAGLIHQLHSRTFNANQLLQIAWACQFRWPGKIVWLKGLNMYLSNQKLGFKCFKVLKEKKSIHTLNQKKMGFEQSHMAATDHNPELIDCSWSPQPLCSTKIIPVVPWAALSSTLSASGRRFFFEGLLDASSKFWTGRIFRLIKND